MNKIKQNYWFWILQFLGWGLLGSLQLLTKLSFSKTTSKAYVFSEVFLILFSGLTISSLLRYYLKKHTDLENLKNHFLKIFVGFIFSSALFTCMMLVASPIYKYFENKELKISFDFIISQLMGSFMFFFFWVLLYYGIKIMMNHNKSKVEKLELKASLKEAELNTLKGQINPHFMFNSLNNIRGLMLEDVSKSREMLTRLSELLRFSLTKNATDKITLTEELEMVKNYLSLSKIQLEDRLQYQESIDVNPNAVEIPPMLIQLLIENAIKHGISKQTNGGIIGLDITENNNNLHIQVKNTGKLTISKNTTKVGIQNIKKRLFLLYGNQAKFSLNQKNNTVIASITFPLNKKTI